MEFNTTEKGNLVLVFNSDINIDNGYTNSYQGNFTSTMELFYAENGTPYMIEWDVPDMEMTECIGLWFEGKRLIDYDGVFELPMEAIKLIRKSGFTVPRHFE